MAYTNIKYDYELKKKEGQLKKQYKGILLLQPTCPIRDLNKVVRAFKIIENRTYDSLVSVSNVGAFHPARMKKNQILKHIGVSKILKLINTIV